jgi:hypothetical protein
VPFESTGKFCRSIEVLDDFDKEILWAEWKEHLDKLDRSIALAESLREAGMDRAKCCAVCIESAEGSTFYEVDSLAVFESRAVFVEQSLDERSTGVVGGSTEGVSFIAAEVPIQERFRRNDGCFAFD